MKTPFQAEPLHVKVKIQMVRKGLSQTDIAKALNLSVPAISNALAARRPGLLKRVSEYVKAFEPEPVGVSQ